MRTTFFKYLLFTMIFSAVSLLRVAEAREITGITVDPSTARITSPDGVRVKITVYADADAPMFCGLRIDFGTDIASQDIKIDSSEGLFPRVVMMQFKQPGTYTIRVKGRKITTHLPCPGKASAVLVVERASPPEQLPKLNPAPPKQLPKLNPAPQEEKFFKSWF